jgi:hypothetical protein
LQDINLLSNVYCPTTECKLDEFTSLGLCESCHSQDVSFDADFWNGGNFADDNFQGCANTVLPTFNATDERFYFNYTAMKDYVVAKEPYSWQRMCTFKEPGYPELFVWITASRLKNETYPSVASSIRIWLHLVVTNLVSFAWNATRSMEHTTFSLP